MVDRLPGRDQLDDEPKNYKIEYPIDDLDFIGSQLDKGELVLFSVNTRTSATRLPIKIWSAHGQKHDDPLDPRKHSNVDQKGDRDGTCGIISFRHKKLLIMTNTGKLEVDLEKNFRRLGCDWYVVRRLILAELGITS